MGMKRKHENRVFGWKQAGKHVKVRVERTTARNSSEKIHGRRSMLAVGEEALFAFRFWVTKKEKNKIFWVFSFYRKPGYLLTRPSSCSPNQLNQAQLVFSYVPASGTRSWLQTWKKRTKARSRHVWVWEARRNGRSYVL